MTNEELILRSVGEIVERLVARFSAQASDHETKMAEHRAAFGARTEADAKIIAGLRSEIGAARMAVLERDSLISERAKLQSIINEQSASAKEAGEKLGWTGNESAIQAVERVVKERDGLLTQVQDMRAEIERLQWENKTMHKDAEDGYAAAIKVLGDPVALSKERDALRAEVAALQARLRASIARGDFAQMEAVDLKAQLQKLTSWAAKNQSARDTMQIEIERLKSQSKAPKYKVGDKLESYNRSLGLVIPITIVGVRTVYDCQADGAEYPVGHSEDELTERYEQTPPEATHAEPDLTQLHAKGKEAWSDVPNATQWVEEMRGNSEATHDTEAGKSAAESVIRDARNAEIVVGDVVRATFWKPGQMSTVTQILPDGRLMLAASSEPWKVDEVVKMVRKCVGADEAWTDVRKVTTCVSQD